MKAPSMYSVPCAKFTMRMMPKISVRPTPRKNSRAACESALTPWVSRSASVDMRPTLAGSWAAPMTPIGAMTGRRISIVVRHLVAGWRRALRRQRRNDLWHRMRKAVLLGGFEDEALLHTLVITLAHKHFALDVVDGQVFERCAQLVGLDAAGLGDTGLEYPLTLPLLALKLVGDQPAMFLLPKLDELLVFGIVDGEGVAGRGDDPKAGIAHRTHGRQLELLGQHRHLGGELVLRRLRQEGVIVVAGEHEIDPVGAGLADLGDVGRIVLGTGRREYLADELLAEPLQLVLEHLDTVVAPGVVEPQRVEALVGCILEIERHRARSHGAGRVGAEEIRHKTFGG